MKINTLLESQTVSSAISNTTTSAPVFGRDEDRLEETTTSGSVTTDANPVGNVQRRSKGSMLKGIKTSAKFPNSKTVKEADEWEEDTEKRERFLQYAKQKLIAAKKNNQNITQMALALSAQDNKYFGSPFIDNPNVNNSVGFGSVTVGPREAKYTDAIARIVDWLDSSQGIAQVAAQQAAVWLQPHGKEFLERVYNDLLGMQDNTVEARQKHAVALSGYQVEHLGGRVRGSFKGLYSNDPADNMTPEVYDILSVVELEIARIKNQQLYEKDIAERKKIWDSIPMPIKQTLAAEHGMNPQQFEAMLFGETDADKISGYYNNQRQEQPEREKEVAEGNKFLQQHGIGVQNGKFPEPRKPRPDGIMSKSEVLGKDGLVYHWQDPRAKQGDTPQGVGEAKKANTKTARKEFGKRPRAELSDKEKEQKKSESDKLWDMLQAHIAQAEKEKKLDEVNPQNFDSDEDYYDAVEADDLDLDKFGNGWDIPDEIAVLRNQLRHTTSQYARAQIENKIKRYEDIYYGEDELEESVAEDSEEVDTHGRTKADWVKAVHAKYPMARVIYSKDNTQVMAVLPNRKEIRWIKDEGIIEQAVAEAGEWTKLPNGNWRNMHTGAQQSTPPKTKKPRRTMGLHASLEQHADDKMKELGHKFKPVDETRVGNRMSDISIGSPKIVHYKGKAVGEVGLDHEASPGNGPFYMKHYLTGKDMVGYDSKQQALADLKHLVMQYEGRELEEGPGEVMALANFAKGGGIPGGQSPADVVDARGVIEEKQRLDPKCWKGYKKQGTKMKGDTRVNNCVKVDEAEISEEMLAHELYKDLQIFKHGKDKTIGKKSKSKDISKKPEDRDIVVKEGTEMKASEILNEGKPGLWANIHAKRERIKSGSGERMRKPGSKGAPSAQDFKDAAKTEAANPAQQAAIAIAMKKKGQKPKSEGVDDREYNDEAGMFKNDLQTIQRVSNHLEKAIQDNENLPEWCQAKIAQAKGMIVNVMDYMISQHENGIVDTLEEEFDLIESIVEGIAVRNNVNSEAIWEDLESLTDDELYVFAVTSEPINEDWQKVNKKDKTDGMSPKAVKAYRRENPGSKLKTAVTTKPSKLKKGSKASKRRKSYCSRSKGQMNMHNISCSKTPDKAICKARRRWNC